MATRKKTARRSKGTSRRGSSGGGNPNNDGRITEEQHEDAMRVLRAEYYQGVRSIAQDLIDRAKSGDIRDGEQLNDATSEAVDGSYWVIYTHANFQVLLCTDHHDEYVENFGEVPMEGRDSIKWNALAFAALERDVRDQIEAEGIEFGGGDLDEAPRRRPSSISAGDRVYGGTGRDRDTGKVVSVDVSRGTAIVFWDSGVQTPADLSDLHLTGERYSGGRRISESRGPRGLRAGRRH